MTIAGDVVADECLEDLSARCALGDGRRAGGAEAADGEFGVGRLAVDGDVLRGRAHVGIRRRRQDDGPRGA